MTASKAQGARALSLVCLVLVRPADHPARRLASAGAEGRRPRGDHPRQRPRWHGRADAHGNRRCLKGFELYKSGAVNRLLVTGGFTRDYISEARMMKIALVTLTAWPRTTYFEEELAATTHRETACSPPGLFDARGWPKAHDR